nr:LysR family transcriptional regulator [Corallococcus exiguus]
MTSISSSRPWRAVASPRRLGIPKSTVSKRVAELEDALGALLIQRTSRSFTLTDVGRDFLDHARAAVMEAEAAENVVRRRQAEPRGVVRITTSVPTAQFRFADRLPLLAHPKVRVELHATDRFVDLVESTILVASPGYLSSRGRIRRPEGACASRLDRGHGDDDDPDATPQGPAARRARRHRLPDGGRRRGVSHLHRRASPTCYVSRTDQRRGCEITVRRNCWSMICIAVGL